jgi:hypothetical protein
LEIPRAETVKSPRRRSDGLFDLILFRAGRGRRHRRANLHRRRPSCDFHHHRRNCGFRRRPNCGLAPNTSAMVPSKSAKEPSTSGTEPGNSGWERNRCETVASTTATAEDYKNVAADCRTAARLNARRWNNSGCCLVRRRRTRSLIVCASGLCAATHPWGAITPGCAGII